MSTFNINVNGQQTYTLQWNPMNAQTALEQAYSQGLTFAVQYYQQFGYYVIMVNGTFDLPGTHVYWEFVINGSSSNVGIDGYQVQPGDTLGFNNVPYQAAKHKGTLMEVKHKYYQSLSNPGQP